MRHNSLSAKAAPLALLDFLLMIGCYLGAVQLCLGAAASPYLLDESGLNAIVFTAAALLGLMAFEELYSPRHRRVGIEIVLRIVTAVGIVFLLQAVVFYVRPSLALPLSVMLAGSAMVFTAVVSSRLIFYGIVAGGLGPERILLLGATPANRAIARQIAARPDFGFAVAGFVEDRLEPGTAIEGATVLGPLASLAEICASLPHHRVIADLPEGELPLSFLVRTGEVSGGMQKPDGLYELLFNRIDAARLQPAALLFGSEFTPPAWRIMLQAVYTDVAALALLLAATPLILAIGVLVKLTSPGPIWDSQHIMGWRLRPFHLLRFRCHRVSAVPGAVRELTPLGSMLRRLHLNALPQLLNVLRGEMTLVGPAPIRVEFAAVLMETLPYHRMRYAAKPGLTGWSQINVADQSDALTVLEYDLYYMKRMSLFLDTSILRYALLPQRAAPDAERAVAGGGA